MTVTEIETHYKIHTYSFQPDFLPFSPFLLTSDLFISMMNSAIFQFQP